MVSWHKQQHSGKVIAERQVKQKYRSEASGGLKANAILLAKNVGTDREETN